MPLGFFSGGVPAALMFVAFCGGAAAAGAAALDPTAVGVAVDRLEKSGSIWPSGELILVCVSGAVAGSLCSVGLELYFQETHLARHPRSSAKRVTGWKICLKMLMQPVFAIVGTVPLIRACGLPLDVVTIMFVSGLIGMTGVYAIKLGLPVVPVLRDWIVPAIGRRAIRIIDPQSASEFDAVRDWEDRVDDEDDRGDDDSDDEEPQPRPKPKPRPKPRPQPRPKPKPKPRPKPKGRR